MSGFLSKQTPTKAGDVPANDSSIAAMPNASDIDTQRREAQRSAVRRERQLRDRAADVALRVFGRRSQTRRGDVSGAAVMYVAPLTNCVLPRL